MPDYGEASISSGAMHRALSGGNHRGAMPRDGQEPELFLAALVPACAKTDWPIRPFCLLPNLRSGTCEYVERNSLRQTGNMTISLTG